MIPFGSIVLKAISTQRNISFLLLVSFITLTNEQVVSSDRVRVIKCKCLSQDYTF